jgi:hypothetical protein
MAHLYLEPRPLEEIVPLCLASILSRAMDDGGSRRPGWLPRRRARRSAWQSLIADAIEGCVLPVPGEPKRQTLLSRVGAIRNNCGGCSPALAGARVARVPTCCLPKAGIANAE